MTLPRPRSEITSLHEDGAALKEVLATREAELKAPLFKGGGAAAAAAAGIFEGKPNSKMERPAGDFKGKHKVELNAPLKVPRTLQRGGRVVLG